MKIRLNRDAAHRESEESPGKGHSRRFSPRVVRLIVAGVGLLVLAGIFVFLQLQRPPVPAGAVVFKAARILLSPGAGWKPVESGGYTLVRDICLPVLEGQGLFKGGTIEVLSSPDFPTSPEIMATNLVNGLRSDPSVLKDTLRVDDFTTQSGLRGIHVACRIVVRDETRHAEAIAHCYLVRNARGRCVRLNYTTVPGHDLEAVHQMVLTTLAPW